MPSIRRLLPIVVVAVALALHLPTRLGGDGSPRPEDQATVAALVAADAPLRAALTDPATAWAEGGSDIGRSRFRPVSDLARGIAVEFAGRDANSYLGWIGWAFHGLLALLVARLARALRADDRGTLLAGLATACAPWMLPAAAWPARLGFGIAAVLATAGLLGAARRRLAPTVVGLTLAVLTHEAALGAVLAAPWVARHATRSDDASDGGGTWRDHWIVPAALAWCAGLAVVASRGALESRTAGGVEGLLAGPAGLFTALGSLLVPTRVALADASWTTTLPAGVVAALGLALLLRWGWTSRASHPLRLACVVVLLPLVAAALSGGVPFRPGYLALVAPLPLAAAGAWLRHTERRSVALRLAATVTAVAWLVAASVSTLQVGTALADGRSLVEYARRTAPASSLARAWELGAGLTQEPQALEEHRAAVDELLEQTRRFVPSDAPGARAGRGRRLDAVQATSLATPLLQYAAAVANSDAAGESPVWSSAVAAADRGAELRPESLRSHLVRAALRLRAGDADVALEAGLRARELAPDDMDAAVLTAESQLVLGLGMEAVATLAPFAGPTLMAGDDTPFELLWARALAADGAFPDVTPDGVRYRYEAAAGVLESLGERLRATPAALPVARQLYDVYLHYGDFLASLDFTAMAALAYERAEVHAHGRVEAAEHAGWLQARLQREIAAANAELAAAQRDRPEDVATAMADLGVAFARANRLDEADAVFARLTEALGGAPPALRYQIAVHRYGARFDAESQGAAERMLATVVEEDPTLVRAHFERGRVLEYLGRFPEAFTEFRRAAVAGALEEWSLDATESAYRLAEYLGETYDPREVAGIAEAHGITEREAHKVRGYLLWRRAVWTLDARVGYDRALHHFAAALDQGDAADPDFTVQFLAAYCHEQLGEAEAAAPLLEKARTRSPSFPGFVLLDSFRASLEGEHGRRVELLETFLERLEFRDDPTFGSELRFLGELHLGEAQFRRERFDSALPHLERAAEIAAETRRSVGRNAVAPSLVLRVARVHQRLDQHDQALELVESVVRDDPGVAANYYNVALVLGGTKRNEEALRYHRRTIERAPGFARAHAKLAYLSLEGNPSRGPATRAARLHLSVYRYHDAVLPARAEREVPDEVVADLAAAEGRYWYVVAQERQDVATANDALQRARDRLEAAIVFAPGCVAARDYLLKVLFQLGVDESELRPHRRAFDEMRESEGTGVSSTFC